MTYTAKALPDAGGMACEVTATAKSGNYRIVTDYLTDPSRNTCSCTSTFVPHGSERLPALRPLRPDRERQRRRRRGQRRRRLGDRRHARPATRCSSRPTRHGDERRQPRLRAAGLRGARRPARGRHRAASSGTAERLDRLGHAHADLRLEDGNVVQTARVAARRRRHGASLALGFGASQAEAVGAAEGSLAARASTRRSTRLRSRLAALRRLAEQAAATSCPGLRQDRSTSSRTSTT